MKRFLASILFLALILGLSGCGSDNPGTNGQLLVTVLPSLTSVVGAGIYSFDVTATYTAPPVTPNNQGSTNVAGVPITFTASVYSATGVLQQTFTDHRSTNSIGVATMHYDIGQTNQPLTVDVTASTGGLSFTTAVQVPALTPTP